MTRVPKAEVDATISNIVRYPAPETGLGPSPAHILAAEVIALREELEAARALAALHAADAKKTREELAQARADCNKMYDRWERAGYGPRYSTEAVDALMGAMDNDAFGFGHGVVADAIEAVRASREPKL